MIEPIDESTGYALTPTTPTLPSEVPVTPYESVELLPAVDNTRSLTLRPLNLPAVERLPIWKQILYGCVALAIAGAYLVFLLHFFVPASPGVDENGYLVGGKQVALTGSTGIKPANPFQFVGMMWVMVGGENASDPAWFYPKYPIGLPLLNAIPLWINWEHGKTWAIYLSPVCTAAALLMIYGLAAEIAGPFFGLLAMLLLGVNYVTLILALLPLSHGPDLLFVTAGVWLLVRWWRGGRAWQGALAGFLIGYATTIRYSEGLLLLPVSLAVLLSIRWRASVLRPWLWRPMVAFAIIAGFVAWRLAIQNHATPLLSALTLLAVSAALFPWRDRTRRGLIVRAVVAGLIGLFIVQCKTPAHVTLDLSLLQKNFKDWKALPHYELKAMLIFAAASLFALIYLYAPCVLRRALLPVLFWIIPVLWLVGFNYLAMGSITGYDTTNESDAFTIDQMKSQWEYAIQQLYDVGGLFILPLAVLGLITMYRWRWQLALLLTTWLLPGVLLYMAYYWGNGMGGVSYLRFFASLLVPMVLAAVWFLRHGGYTRADSPGRGSIALPLAAGAIVAASCGFGLRNALPMMMREQVSDLNLRFTGGAITHYVPKRSVVFCEQRVSMNALPNWLQWAGDYELYAAGTFEKGGLRWGKPGDTTAPNPRQAARQNYLQKILADMNDAQLVATQQDLMRKALTEPTPRGVYAVLPLNWVNPFNARFIFHSAFTWTKVAQWSEQAPVLPELSQTPLMPRPRMAANRAPTSWAIFQITLKPVAPATTRGGNGN